MRFKHSILINERAIELDGKLFKSEKDAGFYLGSINKTPEEIVKLLDTTLPMAKWYARAGKKTAGIKPVEDKPEPVDDNIIPTPSVDKIQKVQKTFKPFVLNKNEVQIEGLNGNISIQLK